MSIKTNFEVRKMKWRKADSATKVSLVPCQRNDVINIDSCNSKSNICFTVQDQ